MPQVCVLCGAASGNSGFCPGCQQDLPWLPAACCPRCTLPTPAGDVCGQCLRAPPAFDRTLCRLAYDFPLDALIQRFKYEHKLALAGPLAGLLRITAATSAGVEMIIPAPLHPQRLRERGFNQVLELLRPWADRQALLRDGVSRSHDGVHQVALPWQQRAKNVKGAFACQLDLRGKKVAIVDDVMTTGATLNELAKTLKRAGASEVECWVLARALPRNG